MPSARASVEAHWRRRREPVEVEKMKNAMCRSRRAFAAVLSAIGIGVTAGAPAWAQAAPSEASVEAHVAAAKRLAGADLEPLMALCKPAPAVRPPSAVIDKVIAAQMARHAPPPGQAFDNLYFVGAAWVSAWAIRT